MATKQISAPSNQPYLRQIRSRIRLPNQLTDRQMCAIIMNTKKSMAHCRVYLNLVRNIQPGSVSEQGGKTDDKSRHINDRNDLTHSVFI